MSGSPIAKNADQVSMQCTMVMTREVPRAKR
jgi:hypothetical protein